MLKTSGVLIGLVGIAAFGLTAPAMAGPKPDTRKLQVSPIVVQANKIAMFDKSTPVRKKFGRLQWIGGLRLTSQSPYFGGWSGLALSKDGQRFIAVSDAGTWMTAKIAYSDDKPASIEGARIGPLKAMSGRVLGRGRDRDAEAVVLTKGTLQSGSLLIAFEQNHRIGRFKIGKSGVSAPSSYVRPPKSWPRMSSLKGFEAIAVLKGKRYPGALLAIAERRHDANNNHTGWLWVKGKARAVTISDIGGFDITGVAALDDGGVILLERRFRWLEGVRMRLRHIGAVELRLGRLIEGEILLAANMSREIDNMEGIGLHKTKAGETIVTLLSDDNFNRGLQRTLLLQFRLVEESVAN